MRNNEPPSDPVNGPARIALAEDRWLAEQLRQPGMVDMRGMSDEQADAALVAAQRQRDPLPPGDAPVPPPEPRDRGSLVAEVQSRRESALLELAAGMEREMFRRPPPPPPPTIVAVDEMSGNSNVVDARTPIGQLLQWQAEGRKFYKIPPLPPPNLESLLLPMTLRPPADDTMRFEMRIRGYQNAVEMPRRMLYTDLAPDETEAEREARKAAELVAAMATERAFRRQAEIELQARQMAAVDLMFEILRVCTTAAATTLLELGDSAVAEPPDDDAWLERFKLLDLDP